MIIFSILLINNNRSKAYLQNLIKYGFIPSSVIVLNDQNTMLAEHTENDKLISKNTNQKLIRKSEDLYLEFDEKEHVLKTLEDNNIKYSLIDNFDINSKDVIQELKKINEDYIIYSGPGGSILGKEILSIGKNFIHVHPGLLPSFRGSTTIYYSMLYNSTVGCSVILFDEGIDEGPILYKNNYKIYEKNIDFDYVLDPLVRTKALLEFLDSGEIFPQKQENKEKVNTFFIIHPLLKHLSIINYNKRVAK